MNELSPDLRKSLLRSIVGTAYTAFLLGWDKETNGTPPASQIQEAVVESIRHSTTYLNLLNVGDQALAVNVKETVSELVWYDLNPIAARFRE